MPEEQEIENAEKVEKPLIHKLGGGGSGLKRKAVWGAGVLVIVTAGIMTGYWLVSGSLPGGGRGISVAPGTEQKGQEVGSTDLKTFKDEATGVLEKGGLDGEGSHKLIREGGPSQTAYLTSSVVDLDQFVGKKVQVWGETHTGQKAAWLMDVGRVKILE